MLEVNFFWAPNVGETMSSDTRDGILFENTETRLVIERGPAIRNANCEDTETVLLTKVRFNAFMLTLRSNDKRSFLLCLDAVVRLAKIAGTEQWTLDSNVKWIGGAE